MHGICARSFEPSELGPLTTAGHFASVIDFGGWSLHAGIGQTAAGLRDLVRQRLLQSGAVLLRNTGFDDPADLSRMMISLGFSLKEYPYFTDNYRRQIGKGVVNASSTAAGLPVPPHTEQAFNRFRPSVVAFMCLTPAASGGETTLHDCFAIWDNLSKDVKGKLERAFFCKEARRMSTEGMISNFNTTDETRINKICEQHGVQPIWQNGALGFRTQGPCVIRHPVSGKSALSCFWTIGSLYYFFRCIHSPESSAMLKRICNSIPFLLFESLARQFHPFFRNDYRYSLITGDRHWRLSASEEEQIFKVVWGNTVAFTWHAGDVLLIDNIRAAHARMPYVGTRRIVASVCDYYDAYEAI